MAAPFQMQASKLSLRKRSAICKFNDQSEKLSSLESTQANESLNKSVASKTPKTHHYSASQSLNYGVAAAVAQKNIWNTYVSDMSLVG